MDARKRPGIGTAAVLTAIMFAYAPVASAHDDSGGDGNGDYGHHHGYGPGMMWQGGPGGYHHGPGMMSGYGYYGATPRERCEARFRSFDPRTGLYTTYGGQKRPCPYLR